MRRSKSRQTPVVLIIFSLLIVISMALSMVEILAPPRRVTPSPTPILILLPTGTPAPTSTSTP